MSFIEKRRVHGMSFDAEKVRVKIWVGRVSSGYPEKGRFIM
jgi:hypothetical protein